MKSENLLKKVGVRDLRKKIEEVVLKLAESNAPGTEKFESALDQIVLWADERVKWKWAGPLEPLFEAMDGPALRKILGGFVEMGYDQLKESGKV